MKIKMLFAGALALTVAIGVYFGGVKTEKAEAASLKTNIFNEELEEDNLDDNNKWITLKEGTSIDVKSIGKEKLRYTANSASGIILQQSEKITVGANQYVEYTVTFEGMISSAVIDFAFVAEKLTDTSAFDGIECVSFYADPAWLRARLNSADSDLMLSGGWGNAEKANTDMGLQWVNGNALLGARKPSSGKYSWKVRVYDDGMTFYSVADAYSDNWFMTAAVGYLHSSSTKTVGFSPLSEGYPVIRVRNVEEMFIGQAGTGVYDYTEQVSGGSPVDGTLSGEKKEDEISGAENALFKPVTGIADMKSALKAIVVDNCADGDLLVKKTKLGAPANSFAKKVYELENDLVVDVSGSAEAVMYIGSSSQKDFSDATALRFGATDGKLTLTVGDKTAEIDAYNGEKFTMTIITDGKWNNDVYVGGNKALSFEKDISDKFIAFGTKGVGGENKAVVGVAGAAYRRYDYKQGTGGDFTETFDNGKYNKANMAFAYRVEDLQNYMYADRTNGRLTINNVGYTGVISTKQTYGDFDFTFEIAELGTTKLDDGSEAPCNFCISWGRAAAESDYASGGCGLYLVWGNDLNIMGGPEVKYAEGYGAICNFNVPTDKTDEQGNPLGRSNALWDYNFSEGNIVFRTVKKDHRVEVYVYTAESAENDVSRTKPVCVIENDYSYGYVGLCGVPTGKPMSMQLDSFSIKNLDEHKADNLVVGTDADVTDLDFTPDVSDDDIPDPFESESKNNGSESSGGKSSCKGAVELPVTLAFVLCGAAAILGIKRKKNY